MRKKILPLILCLGLTVSGCGKDVTDEQAADNTASAETDINADDENYLDEEVDDELSEDDLRKQSASKDSSLLPIEDWEKKWFKEAGYDPYSFEKFDKSIYTEKAVDTKVAELAKNSSSISDEMENADKIGRSYQSYHGEDLTQTDMNILSYYEEYFWEQEMKSLLDRLKKEGDKKTVEADQKTWEGNFKKCFELIEYDEGSWAGMQNCGLYARFYSNRCYMLAQQLSDIRKDSYKLPKRFYRDNSYVGDDGILDISCGMEGGSIAISYKDKDGKETALLVYDSYVNDNTIVFDDNITVWTEDDDCNEFHVSGTITYGWDGATIKIDDSKDELLPAGTEKTFSTAL